MNTIKQIIETEDRLYSRDEEYGPTMSVEQKKATYTLDESRGLIIVATLITETTDREVKSVEHRVSLEVLRAGAQVNDEGDVVWSRTGLTDMDLTQRIEDGEITHEEASTSTSRMSGKQDLIVQTRLLEFAQHALDFGLMRD